MRTLSVDDPGAIDTAAAALGAGAVIVVPTDTVYGLAARPDDDGAVDTIYRAKQRPDGLQLPVLAGTLDQVRQLGVAFSEAAMTLATRWWPGPLTMAFGFSPELPRPLWLAGREEVAVRIPQHPFLLALTQRTGVLVVTSANRHGADTPATADAAAAQLAPHVALAIDGGVLDAVPSTLVNVRTAAPVIERVGAVARSDIDAALGHRA